MNGDDSSRRQLAARVLERVRQAFFALAGLVLLAMALILVAVAVWNIGTAMAARSGLVPALLKNIGLVIVATAIFDIASFLIEEELTRDRELRSLHEARLSLTKFLTIVIVAVLLEGIVQIAQTTLDRPETLIYPTLLIAVGVLALVGLGVFQRLTATARARDPAVDEDVQAHVASGGGSSGTEAARAEPA